MKKPKKAESQTPMTVDDIMALPEHRALNEIDKARLRNRLTDQQDLNDSLKN
jgi:hypothetical protein